MTQWLDVVMADGKAYIVSAPEGVNDWLHGVEDSPHGAFFALDALITSAKGAQQFPGQDTATVFVRADDIAVVMVRHGDALAMAKEMIKEEEALIKMFSAQTPGAAPPPDAPVPAPATPLTQQQRERLLTSGSILSAEDLAKLIKH